MDRATELMDRAVGETGLDDFGEGSFREGLGILLTSLEGEARLSEPGKEATLTQLVGTLAQRLHIENWYRLHPEIDDEQINAPLIGLGLPRTGSTAFSCLLAEDAAVRYVRTWEAMSPLPPPEKRTEHTDHRIELARQALAKMDELAPRLKTMLPSSPTSPSECHPFMAYDFKSHAFASQAHIPSYLDWLVHEADLVPTYRYLKRVLKLLQWRCPPNRWRLKNPSHILFINALNEVFPDARFWMTHRDVAKVIPSTSDLWYELTSSYANDVDKAFLGRKNAEVWQIGMERLIAFRDAGNEHRFVDVHFAEFQRDPFPSIAAVYNFLGEELTDDALARMVAWRENTPREKHGNHTYELADFGIDAAELHEQFSFYHDRFDVLECA